MYANCRTLEGPIKSLLSVSLSVCPSVWRFSQKWPNNFSYFWHDGRESEYPKTDRAPFSRKIHFCPNLSKWPENNIFLDFLKKILINFSCK